jgi:hypothetical protein
MCEVVSISRGVTRGEPRDLRLLSFHRWDQIHLGSVSIKQSVPWVAGKEFYRVRSALTKELEQFIKEPRSGNDGRPRVERMSIERKGAGSATRVGAELKHVNIVPEGA